MILSDVLEPVSLRPFELAASLRKKRQKEEKKIIKAFINTHTSEELIPYTAH